MDTQLLTKSKILELERARSTWVWTLIEAANRIQEINDQITSLHDQLAPQTNHDDS